MKEQISIYALTVVPMKRMLLNVDSWLSLAEAHADKKKFDVDVLLSSRLAPDQYPLVRQIQSVCDQAKFTAARLTGREPPKHPDTEQTVVELRTRLRNVLEYLDTFRSEDFDGTADRRVMLPYLKGRAILGRNYVNELQLPNFYFHATTAYAILRHNGIDLGKMNFLAAPTLEPE